MNLSFLAPSGFASANAEGVYEIPFLDRMFFVFVICIIGMWAISMYENSKGLKPNALVVDKKMFRMAPSFVVGAIIIIGMLVALYTIYW